MAPRKRLTLASLLLSLALAHWRCAGVATGTDAALSLVLLLLLLLLLLLPLVVDW